MTNPSQVAIHLAFNALFGFQDAKKRWPTPGSEEDLASLNALINQRLTKAGYIDEQVSGTQVDEAATAGVDLTFRQHIDNVIGEM
jgi:hypothetical protein